MNGYHRLTSIDRIRIKDFLSTGLSQTEIANKLKVHKSAISREIKRNSGSRGYRPLQAHRWAEERQTFHSCLRKWTPVLEKKVRALLKKRWSPEQISERLKLEKQESISHQRIYEFIEEDKLFGGDLWKSLSHSQKLRKKRSHTPGRRGQIKEARSIEERSLSVERRSLRVKVFFCHPYSSNERGSNENHIGVIRQYLPKRTRLLDLTWYRIKKIEREINSRPMKCLNWRSPLEAHLNRSVKLTA